MSFGYARATYELEHLGTRCRASAEDVGAMTIGDERCELLQFHGHVPSEHALEGDRSDLEVHLVHQNDQDHVAVPACSSMKAAASRR